MKANLAIFIMLIVMLLLTSCQSTGGSQTASTGAAQIDREVDVALAELFKTTPSARELATHAKGILVFPNILKAGFIAGAQYGKGAMRKGGRTSGYYNIVAGSYGLQAGVQSFGYVLFFMNDAALSHLDSSSGLEIGVGPSIVVLNEGMARTLTTTTLREDVYAFVFNQSGLMAGLGLQGSKITRTNP
jgi:lipid-binding SYLF domain-containing protein